MLKQVHDGKAVEPSTRDVYWMQQAIALAIEAQQKDEVPVGAIIILNDKDVVVGRGHNKPIQHHDPTAHAEIVAIRDAAHRLKNYRLNNTSLYVTLEPCMMCVGALIHARINRLIFGAYDHKSGAVVTQSQLLDVDFINHRIRYQGGVLQSECSKMLSNFFQQKRNSTL